MQIEHLMLRNWRNFRTADVDLPPRVFLIGPNASGKTNLLDALRFLRDVAHDGLQAAVAARRGVHMLRNFAAAPDADIEIAIAVADDGGPWTYRLVLNHDSAMRGCVVQEMLSGLGETISQDGGITASGPIRHTLLEGLNAHDQFGPCAKFFKTISSPLLVHDHLPGSGFLPRMWQTAERTRTARLKKIERVLQIALPQLSKLDINADEAGNPHLNVAYSDWRRHTAHDERDLSDGTLRIVALLWSMFDGAGPLLLEEPESALHHDVVAQLAQIMGQMNRQKRIQRQILISTHSEDLLRDGGIAAEEVLRLVPVKGGSVVASADDYDRQLMREGMSVAEVMLPKSAPPRMAQLAVEL